MTTYSWAQLDAGTYALPGPAVVLSPWVLEVRAQEPELFDFTHVTGPEQWPQVGTARQVVADFTDPWDMLVISADRPDDVYVDLIHFNDRGCEIVAERIAAHARLAWACVAGGVA